MGKHSDYKRVRHHDMPGDVTKTEKIEMRETGRRFCEYLGIDIDCKPWLKMIYAKTRAVLKRRLQRDLREQSDDTPEKE